MSDEEKHIGESILMVKTEGFRGGFLNPFRFKVIVESETGMTQKTPYKAVFLLKDPEDARQFMNEVARNKNLRIWIVGEERALVKAIETIGKSPDVGKKDLDIVRKIAQMSEFADNKQIRKAANDIGVKGILEERIKEARGYHKKLEMAGKEI